MNEAENWLVFSLAHRFSQAFSYWSVWPTALQGGPRGACVDDAATVFGRANPGGVILHNFR